MALPGSTPGNGGLFGTSSSQDFLDAYNAHPAASPTASPTAARPTAPSMDGINPETDSGYRNAAGRLIFQNSGAIQDLEDKRKYAETDYKEGLRRMALSRIGDLQGADESYNRQGLFYSGQLGKARGEIESNYANREADQRNAFDRLSADVTNQIGRLQKGQDYDLEDLRQAAIERIFQGRRQKWLDSLEAL